MDSKWNSEFNFQASSYSKELYGGDSRSDTEFTFIDFYPKVLVPSGIFTAATCETFRTLIDRANDWLRTNRKWKITTCESVEFKSKGDRVDSNKMTYLEYGETMTSYIRGLRLWLTERTDESEREQQIGYLNLIPQQVDKGGIFKSPTYESLDSLLGRFNSMLHSNPLAGRIITIESQEMKLKDFRSFDPDRSNWSERGDVYKHFVFVLRIFYEVMTGCTEEIGVKDFVPNLVSSGGICSLPKYEPFSNVVSHASTWCSQQQNVRICNAQSLEMKLKRGKDINTQRMDYAEYGNVGTFYVRILRVAYTKLSTNPYVHTENSCIRQLTCKTFVPVQLTSSVFVPEYENLFQTKERVTAWVKATGARVMSAETCALRLMTGGERKYGTEATVTFNTSEMSEYWIFVIRLYLDGVYREPPLEMLPSIPDLEQNCCAIS